MEKLLLGQKTSDKGKIKIFLKLNCISIILHRKHSIKKQNDWKIQKPRNKLVIWIQPKKGSKNNLDNTRIFKSLIDSKYLLIFFQF